MAAPCVWRFMVRMLAADDHPRRDLPSGPAVRQAAGHQQVDPRQPRLDAEILRRRQPVRVVQAAGGRPRSRRRPGNGTSAACRRRRRNAVPRPMSSGSWPARRGSRRSSRSSPWTARRTGRRRLSGTCGSGRRSIPGSRTAHSARAPHWQPPVIVGWVLYMTSPWLALRKKLPNRPAAGCGGKFLPIHAAMPISIDHIIERMGGADAAARLTGVGNRGGAQMAPEPGDPVPPLARGDRGHRLDHG